MLSKSFSSLRDNQQGATLVVGLIILALLTVVGLTSLDVTTVDVKVVANSKDRQIAFNGAESALFEGGLVVRDNDGALDTSVQSNVDDGFVGNAHANDATWWSSSSNWSLAAVSGSDIEADTVIESPHLVRPGSTSGVTKLNIPATGAGRRHAFYPVTSRADGPGNAAVVLQSHFVKIQYPEPAK